MNSESGREKARAPEPGPSALDLLQRWGQMVGESGPEARAPEPATPANSGQARRGRDEKTSNSRRKEKRRRRANSLSVRRRG